MSPRRTPWPHPIVVDELAPDDEMWSLYESDLRKPHPQFKETWWLKTKGFRNLRHFVAISDGIEVARVTVKLGGRVLADYRGAEAGRPAAEILYIEVASDARYNFSGIGTEVVMTVSDLLDGVVFAKADKIPGGFWARLGWNEYPPTGRPEHAWRVFVRPD